MTTRGRIVATVGFVAWTAWACSTGTSPSSSPDAGDGTSVADLERDAETGLPDPGTDEGSVIFPEIRHDADAVTDADAQDAGEGATPELVPQCEPGEGCFLDPCQDGTDCLSGWCIEHVGKDVCTDICVEECPAGFDCTEVAAAGTDVTFICASNHPRLCLPCIASSDCKTTLSMGGECVTYGAEVGSFCGSACAAGTDCPAGYSCAPVLTVEGLPSMQCFRDGSTCPCTDKAVALGLHTACEAANEIGTCPGQRVCTAAGLGECDAPVPAEDLCDGLDNDCDGDQDEGTCDDGNPCTMDSCEGQDGCKLQPLTGIECSDGNLCTTGDHCEAGTCVGFAVECDDGNPCTDDACSPAGKCESEPNHDLCDDGDPCSVGDVCDSGQCSGTPVSCDCATDKDCAKLDDGNPCNGTLFCNLSEFPYKCQVDPASLVTCKLPPDADPFCQKAWCNPGSGKCEAVPDHEGFACDDGNPCTVAEKCVEGGCAAGLPYPCNDANPCTEDVCLPESGCVFTSMDSPCSDGNACTEGDNCANAVCIPGQPLVCKDGNPCTDDLCDPQLGCHFEPKPGPCEDGNPCTAGEACLQGKCVGGQLTDCNDDNPCTKDSCQLPAGCLHEPLQAPCDDGSLCTQDDQCKNGICTGGAPPDCNDANPCTDDDCAPATGCQHTSNTAPCNDGNVCTTIDTCAKSACTGSNPLSCDDGNPCTDDSCDPKKGCLFVPNAAACDDGDVCTLGDQCLAGQCHAGPPKSCDDGDPCTDDDCDPEQGCVYTLSQGLCDDGNACTWPDFCNNGVCTGLVHSCDDGIECTGDVCDGKGGCSHTVKAGKCLIDGACHAAKESQPDDDCQECKPEVDPTAWTPATGKVCAVVAHGAAFCSAGTCLLSACDQGFGDCDKQLDTGCETDLKTSKEHCGKCANPCQGIALCFNAACTEKCPPGLENCKGACVDLQQDLDNCGGCAKPCVASAPTKNIACAAGQCKETACPANNWNVDLAGGNGCEYFCIVTNAGKEACDGLDNDCDGKKDEDFNFLTDPDNCGACGKKCTAYPNVKTATCGNGTCAIATCVTGFANQDDNVENGCETAVVAGELWVDSWNFNDPQENGSKLHPFDTLAEAIAAAGEGYLIRVLEGVYDGSLTVTKAGLIIRSEVKWGATIGAPAGGTSITIKAANVTLEDLEISGGRYGIVFDTAAKGTVLGVRVISLNGYGSSAEPTSGLRALNSSDILVDRADVSKLYAAGGHAQGYCTNGSPGGWARGIELNNCTGCTVANSVFHELRGGNGGPPTGGWMCGPVYGDGGYATAIDIVNSKGAFIRNNIGYDLAAGSGSGGLYSACVFIQKSTLVKVLHLTCADSKTYSARGVWLAPNDSSPVEVVNSIFYNLSEYCLASDGSNSIPSLTGRYSDLSCTAGKASNATVEATCISVNPLFAEGAANYHLQAGSPCIDAGKPTLDYCAEPSPNGCAPDLGAYGNTAQATSKAGAPHCPCP